MFKLAYVYLITMHTIKMMLLGIPTLMTRHQIVCLLQTVLNLETEPMPLPSLVTTNWPKKTKLCAPTSHSTVSYATNSWAPADPIHIIWDTIIKLLFRMPSAWDSSAVDNTTLWPAHANFVRLNSHVLTCALSVHNWQSWRCSIPVRLRNTNATSALLWQMIVQPSKDTWAMSTTSQFLIGSPVEIALKTNKHVHTVATHTTVLKYFGNISSMGIATNLTLIENGPAAETVTFMGTLWRATWRPFLLMLTWGNDSPSHVNSAKTLIRWWSTLPITYMCIMNWYRMLTYCVNGWRTPTCPHMAVCAIPRWKSCSRPTCVSHLHNWQWCTINVVTGSSCPSSTTRT